MSIVFKSELSLFGLEPERIISDKKIHRFDVDDKKLVGWYVFYENYEANGGSFGNLETGLYETYSEFSDNITDDHRIYSSHQIKIMNEKASKEILKQIKIDYTEHILKIKYQNDLIMKLTNYLNRERNNKEKLCHKK